MAIINCAECGNAFSDKASACPHCGCPIEFAKPQSAINKLSSNARPMEDDSKKSFLREYLEKIRLLETDIYTMNQIIPNLRKMIKDYSSVEEITSPRRPLKFSPPVLYQEDIWNIDDRCKEYYDNMRSRGVNLISALKYVADSRKNLIIENKLIEKRNEKRKIDYQQELKDYNEKYLPQYEEEMLEYKKQLAKYEMRVKTAHAQVDLYNQGIDNQIACVVAERDRTQQALQTLYDTNIIFAKYRGIVPVTMFCEYMDSGRRTTLEGVHGMYDLYESELLGKRIVESIGEVNRALDLVSYQLNGIADQLTGIARNQIMLHEEIAKGNAISAKISMDTSTLLENSVSMLAATGKIHDELNSIHKIAQTTEANTAATAYSAEVAARRVDAIAKIEEYEFSLRHPMFPSV